MKAYGILFTQCLALDDVDEELFGQPACLVSLLGKPMLQRVVEQLVSVGCVRIHVVLGNHATLIKQFLQTGERWGCEFVYHYLDTSESIGRLMTRLGVESETIYYLAQAHQLPVIDMPQAGDVWGEEQCWTGWACLTGEWLLAQYDVPALLESLLLKDPQLCHRRPLSLLQVRNMEEYFASCQYLLKQECTETPKVWQGCDIHHTAILIAPVYLGAQVKIAAQAVVGPHAVLESGVFVDVGSHVENSIVLSDTYIGEGLGLSANVASGSLLANVSLQSVTEVVDDNLLCDLRLSSVSTSWLLCFKVLYWILLPLYLLASLRYRCLDSVNLLPTQQNNSAKAQVNLVLHHKQHYLKHFCDTFYPGLHEVAQGKLALLGPQLRSAEEVRKLPAVWKYLYRHYRCGLLNDALLEPCLDSADGQFASDAFAAANQQNIAFNLQLLRRYLGRVMKALFHRSANTTEISQQFI